MLESNKNAGKKLKRILKNTEKYWKIQKNTDLQGFPFGSMLDNNTNTERKTKKDTERHWKLQNLKKVGNCVLQIALHQFLWVKYLTEFNLFLFFLHFAVKLKRKIKICLFRPRQIYLEYLGAIKMRDKDEISIWNIWMWIKWETKFRNSYGQLSMGLNI